MGSSIFLGPCPWLRDAWRHLWSCAPHLVIIILRCLWCRPVRAIDLPREGPNIHLYAPIRDFWWYPVDTLLYYKKLCILRKNGIKKSRNQEILCLMSYVKNIKWKMKLWAYWVHITSYLSHPQDRHFFTGSMKSRSGSRVGDSGSFLSGSKYKVS